MSKYEKAARRDIERDDASEEKATRGLCRAFGCPERGTISPSCVGPAGDTEWYCRHHFGEPAHLWPEITRERMKAKSKGSSEQPAALEAKRTATGAIDVEHYRAQLRSFRGVGAPPSKDWAWRLKQLEDDGKPISEVQRSAWRAALRVSASSEVSLEG